MLEEQGYIKGVYLCGLRMHLPLKLVQDAGHPKAWVLANRILIPGAGPKSRM